MLVLLVCLTVDSIRAEAPVSVKLVDSAAYFLSKYSLSGVVTEHRAREQH